jgi:hypothetical protein
LAVARGAGRVAAEVGICGHHEPRTTHSTQRGDRL